GHRAEPQLALGGVGGVYLSAVADRRCGGMRILRVPGHERAMVNGRGPLQFSCIASEANDGKSLIRFVCGREEDASAPDNRRTGRTTRIQAWSVEFPSLRTRRRQKSKRRFLGQALHGSARVAIIRT